MVDGQNNKHNFVIDMSNTSEAPLWIVIIRNVLASAAVGILIGCMMFPLFSELRKANKYSDYNPFNVSLLYDVLSSPILIVYIFPLLLPLVSIACLAGIIFQKSIQKYLVFWCIASPFLVYFFTIIAAIQIAGNEGQTKFEEFTKEIINPDNFIFLIAASASSAVFYILSRKGLRW